MGDGRDTADHAATARASTGDQLRESEARFRATFDLASIGIAHLSPGGQWLRINRRLATWLELPAEDLIGRTVEWVALPDDLAADFRDMARLLSQGERTTSREKRYLRRDGSARWARLSLALARDDGGTPLYHVLSVEDVSAYHQWQHVTDVVGRTGADLSHVHFNPAIARDTGPSPENAPASSELRLRRLVESNIVGVLFGEGERITEANDAFLHMVGYTREELLGGGLHWPSMTPPEYAEMEARAGAEILASGSCAPIEKEYIAKDGRRVPVLIGGTMIQQTPFRWASVIVDLTKRKRAEVRLRALQRQTAALGAARSTEEVAEVVVTDVLRGLEADGGSLVLLDPGGDTVRILRGIGYTADADRAWVGVPIPIAERMPVTDAIRTGGMIHLESLADWRERYPAVAHVHEENGFEGLTVVPCRVDHRILGAIALSFRTPRLLTSEEGEFAAAIAQQCAQALDRVRLYALAVDAREEAERASRAKSDFLAMMSHDLRTPLNAIAGYAELLDLQIAGPVTEEQRLHLRRIRASGQYLLGLIDSILTLARLESGRVEYRPADVPLGELLAEVEPLVIAQFEAKGMRYVCEPGDASLMVRVDHDKALQILVNLVSNAVKFSQQGEVTLTMAPGALRDGAPAVSIRVHDTGCGIASDMLELIFEPFVQLQADGPLSRESRAGVGLGLAISRQLALDMGGELRVESVVGTGSTFTLVLPRSAERRGG